MTKETAGRDYLGSFAPEFARINDDILFGEIWAKEDVLSPKQRSMLTISGLMGAGILDQSMDGHIERAKKNGVTKQEMTDLVTHLAFYLGWPKGWSMFAKIMEVYVNDDSDYEVSFGKGKEVTNENFSGKVFVESILDFKKPMLVDNVSFEPGSYNNWHIHQAGQTLLVVNGKGWYQEEGKEAQALHAGDVIDIPAGVKHWHGASKDSWFTHLALEDPSKGAPEWLDRISKEDYDQLHD